VVDSWKDSRRDNQTISQSFKNHEILLADGEFDVEVIKRVVKNAFSRSPTIFEVNMHTKKRRNMVWVKDGGLLN
jgi:hypothetical protein